MDDTVQLTGLTTLEDAVRANEQVTAFLDERAVSPETTGAVALAVEELLTNSIKYGGKDGRVPHVRLDLAVTAQGVVLSLADDGLEFNPLEAPHPDLNCRLEDRPIGGLGLHLVRTLASSIGYQRKDGWNIVTVVFGPRNT
ncbi:MAG: ATP-binding protein [Candidatus Riflebacteria bacterium]|nr:ATP-binding protein [Candidatus Riflebacteria bacterium]